jgi:serine/threonine protein kinase
MDTNMSALREDTEIRSTVRIKLSETPHDPADSTVFSRTEGTTLESQYQWVDKIGGGGMGVVYLARDRRLGRVVAIKRLHAKCLADENLKSRLFVEARATASLSHIHIVHIYALGEDTDGPYIVMEYIGGPQLDERDRERIPPPYTLADRIHREGPMALDVAIDFVLKLCRAMEYAHESKVVHRDLKPSNVLLDAALEPKIVDFGLAQVRQEDAEPLTLPGERMLSLGYGAPEQESDASLADERADVYGLGALLYFCVTGKNPRYFRQNDLPEVIRMPVVKALETDRDQRWQSVAAFRAVLQQTRAPGDLALPTGKVTWRCKWCDTVNPVVVRFCGKCGWDGGVFCPECGSESRFGTQFCGICGSDAKQYEAAMRVLNEMRMNMDRKEFVLVAQEEQSIGGFRPQGANGRNLLEQVHEIGEKARAALRRRTQIRSEIEHGLSMSHYEQVRSLIEEYNKLSFDRAFDELHKKLDSLQLDRDMRRLRDALANGQWDYAKGLLHEIRYEGQMSSELLFFREQVAAHYRWRRIRRRMLRVLSMFFIYLLLAAPLQRAGLQGPVWTHFWRPANQVQFVPGIGSVFKAYAEWFGRSVSAMEAEADPGDGKPE